MPLNNFGTVDSFVWRSAQPDELGIFDLSKLGCKHVIKLNTETPEEIMWCPTYGITLEQLPIPTFINDVQNIENIATRLQNVSHQNNNLTLIHCEHGRDRTGLIVAAYRIMYCGYTVQQADTERKAYGVEGWIAVADLDMEFILAQIYMGVHP